jgi:hypothetical protein
MYASQSPSLIVSAVWTVTSCSVVDRFIGWGLAHLEQNIELITFPFFHPWRMKSRTSGISTVTSPVTTLAAKPRMNVKPSALEPVFFVFIHFRQVLFACLTMT